MKIFNKLRILGAAAAFVLMASPLAQAASKPGLDEVLKANALLDQAPAVQYNLKGTFFTPIISGNVIAAGQIQDPKEKDAPNQMKMEGNGDTRHAGGQKANGTGFYLLRHTKGEYAG